MPGHLIGTFAAILCIFAACGKGDPEIVGFGTYKIGESTPKDGYVCRPQGEQTYCSNNPSPMIAGHKTQTDLYFRGHGDDAPLVEILVGIWQCDPGAVQAGLSKQLGAPDASAEQRVRWNLKRMVVVGLLPSDPELCTLHFLDHGEKQRIEALWSGAVQREARDKVESKRQADSTKDEPPKEEEAAPKGAVDESGKPAAKPAKPE
jgi:hypothetical protein